jgi:hypothetical protein
MSGLWTNFGDICRDQGEHNPYYGMTRSQLLPVLEKAHGNRDNVPDPEAFRTEWALDNQITSDEPQETPEEKPAWSHPEYPESKIAAMEHGDLCTAIESIGEKLPRGYDLMHHDDLRDVFRKMVCSEPVKIRYEIQQTKNEAIVKKNNIIEKYEEKLEEKSGKPRYKKGERETPEYIDQPRGWFEREGRLYLELIDTSHEIPEYSYATWKDGKIAIVDDIVVKEPFTDKGKVLESGLRYVPRYLPLNKDGQVIHLVGIPEKKQLEMITRSDAFEIKTEIYKHVNRYCDLSPNDLDLCLYYIFMTWFYPKLSTLPYLRLKGDTGKGKSRILKVISDISFMPVRAGGASSSAGTVRFQEYWHGTLIIDEADLKGEADDSGGYTNDMVKYLNLGFEKGQYFIKSDKVDPRRQEIFDPFSPKIVGMRGTFQDPATEGRCLSISPSETERTDIPPILPDNYDHEVARIRAMLTHYTISHWSCITDADPYPAFNDVVCEPRLKQLGSPMARVISKIFPDGITEFKHYIERRQTEIRIDRSMSFFGTLANAVYDCSTDPENISNVVKVVDVTERTGVTSTKASRGLKESGFCIEPRFMEVSRKNDNGTITTKKTTVKTIRVKDQRTWREIYRRYIIPKNEQQTIGSSAIDDMCPVAIRSGEYVNN